ncbi:unnamed protein product [Arabidopsis thaliana]|uniref:(thale cress) hypothetical protein n=1 Tax=Arabidopsis thaliana TaxID=3702 RepID=A0A7G2E519_ARATH|nr:unnamed protein product [Arabidopsis thaliana]
MAIFDLSSKSFDSHLNFPRTFDDHSDSGVCSPPLWRTSPPKSPAHLHNNYQNLSPVTKAQVIARGQRELMDMVSKMPESCYELSLKDLVEVNTEEEKVFDEMPQREKKPRKVVRKTKSDKWVDPIRNGGVNNSGFLLKLVFPVSLGAKKKTNKKKDNDDDDSSVTSKRIKIGGRMDCQNLVGVKVLSRGSTVGAQRAVVVVAVEAIVIEAETV